MLNIGGGELLIILLVALIFLGPERLPGVARQAGQMMTSLRSLASGFQEEVNAAARAERDATDDASSMSLNGPTDQAEAIASTQTDPAAIAAAARAVTHDDEDDPSEQSSGGPFDLRDEEE